MLGLFWRFAPYLAIAGAALVWHYRAVDEAEQRGYAQRDAEYANARIEWTRALDAERAANRDRTAALEARVRELRQQLDQRHVAIARTVHQHLDQQEREWPAAAATICQESPDDTPPARPLLGHAVLDERTVRLLDAARRGPDADRAASSGAAPAGADEASGAPAPAAPVTGAAFAANDLEVVRLYHQLAARHAGLVEWVREQCLAPGTAPIQPSNP